MPKRDFEKEAIPDTASFMHRFAMELEDGAMKIILDARGEAMANQDTVQVSVRTKMKLLGADVWLWMEFDGRV